MEDILAIVVVLATVGLIYALFKYIDKKQKAKREQLEAKQREADEYLKNLRAKRKEAAQQNTLSRVVASTSSVPPRGKETTVSYAPSPTQEVQSYNSRSLLDDVADVAMIANTIRHWNDNERRTESEPVREERSVGISKSESSWGFDDSDSRKSVSDTFGSSSSSDSWSSSSSDSFSSSASSDW